MRRMSVSEQLVWIAGGGGSQPFRSLRRHAEWMGTGLYRIGENAQKNSDAWVARTGRGSGDPRYSRSGLAAEKLNFAARKAAHHPSAAEAEIVLLGLGGTDKSVPFQNRARTEFFRSLWRPAVHLVRRYNCALVLCGFMLQLC